MNAPDPLRPDPDALLAKARRQGRGRLKVYLGMAPGVGKTYEMLTAGRRRAAEGVDVVVGMVETHGRAETEALVGGLEVLPRGQDRNIANTTSMEFDLDAALRASRACCCWTSTPTPTFPAPAIPSAGRTWRSCSPPASTSGPR